MGGGEGLKSVAPSRPWWFKMDVEKESVLMAQFLGACLDSVRVNARSILAAGGGLFSDSKMGHTRVAWNMCTTSPAFN